MFDNPGSLCHQRKFQGKGRFGTDCGKRKRRITRHESGQSEIDIILGKGIICLNKERRNNGRESEKILA